MAIKKDKPKILVTGGAGFIGSHLVDALILRGYAVRVLDNLAPPSHNGKLPAWFHKNAEFLKGDVRVKKDWEKALTGVSYVFHLAAYMDYHMDFSTYVSTNTESAALLYEAIVEKKLPIKKIIFASSQAVYGEGKYLCPRHGEVYAAPREESQLKRQDWECACHCGRKFIKVIPQKEGDELFPGNPYGISKEMLEKLALHLGKAYKIPTVILRYSIVHGARQSFRHFYSGALRSFVVPALAREPIEMREDARQLRDFVHIKDAISSHIKVLESPKADYEIFNIGSGRKGDTVLKLGKLVSKYAGVPFRPVIKGVFRRGSTRHSLMNVEKLKKLGWEPKCKLEDSARDYLVWVKQYPEAIGYLHRTYNDMKKRGITR